MPSMGQQWSSNGATQGGGGQVQGGRAGNPSAGMQATGPGVKPHKEAWAMMRKTSQSRTGGEDGRSHELEHADDRKRSSNRGKTDQRDGGGRAA